MPWDWAINWSCQEIQDIMNFIFFFFFFFFFHFIFLDFFLIIKFCSSGDVVHAFMSSFGEKADAENTLSHAHFSMCSKQLCGSGQLIYTQNKQDSYLKVFFFAA